MTKYHSMDPCNGPVLRSSSYDTTMISWRDWTRGALDNLLTNATLRVGNCEC